MLDVRDIMRSWFKSIVMCIFISVGCVNSLGAFERPQVRLLQDNSDTVGTAIQGIKLIEQEQDVQSLIYLIVNLKKQLTSQGCYFPPLTEFLQYCRIELGKIDIEIEQSIFDRLYEEFDRIDNCSDYCEYLQTKHKHHKKGRKEKEVNINGKTAVGFLKFVGGSLICIIPLPIIQGAGAALAVIGLNDMMDGVREHRECQDAQDRFDANRRIEAQLNP